MALLTLNPISIYEQHEYWRLLTFLFVIPFQNPLFAFFYLYFQYLCGSALEEEWGSFPVTVFYLLGASAAIAAAFIVGMELESALFFNDSVFLAFAALYPEFQVLFFFVIPLKIKWIAWFTWFRILLGLWGTPVLYKIAIVVSLTHYLIFFGKKHFDSVRDRIERYRHQKKYKDWNAS
jgi:hypothetical protein